MIKPSSEELDELKDLRFKFVCFMLFLGLIVFLCIFIIRASIVEPEDDSPEVNFEYSIANTINYKVHLAPESPWDESYLGMNRQYPSEFLKYIEIDFVSNIQVSKPAIIDYNYEVLAEINGTYSSDNSRKETDLWHKDFELVEKTENNINKKSANIRKRVDIEYPIYNNLVHEFKREVKLNIDAKLAVKMLVNYQIKVGSEIINKELELLLELPLSKAAFVINTKVPEKVSDTIYKPVGGSSTFINTPLILIASVFLIIALSLLINYLAKIIKLNKKTEYATNLNKILKNFGDIIVESKTPVDSSHYEILEIAEFEDLVDAENEVRIPIIYYEKTKGLEGWFTLVHERIMYRYILYGKPGNKRHKHSKSV